jgi:hypothetical protein
VLPRAYAIVVYLNWSKSNDTRQAASTIDGDWLLYVSVLGKAAKA